MAVYIAQLVVAIGYSTTGHSVADIIQNAASRTQSKELVVVNSNQLIKRTATIKPTWHAPWKLMRVSIICVYCICMCVCLCLSVCACCVHVCMCVLRHVYISVQHDTCYLPYL